MKVIYTDNNATTKVADEVIEEMVPYLGEFYGNPSNKKVRKFGNLLQNAQENSAYTDK